jgi:hypothetical protein
MNAPMRRQVKALMKRIAARGLYDLSRLAERTPSLLADPLARALVARTISSSGSSPVRRILRRRIDFELRPVSGHQRSSRHVSAVGPKSVT